MPSVSICASSRRRPAPSAVRIAISFCRDAVRASSRFERLAQTISITIADRAGEHPDREPDAAADLFGQRLDVALEAVALRMLGGDLRRERPNLPPAPASTVTPGLSRPIIAIVLPQRFVSWLSGNGK